MSARNPNSEGLASPLRSEMSNGCAASDRTVPRHRSRSALLAAFVIGFALFSTPTTVHAWSCSASDYVETYSISLCKKGACTQGFTIEHRPIPHRTCSSRPVVRDLTEYELANFRTIIQHLGHEMPNGIYQLVTYPICLGNIWQSPSCLALSLVGQIHRARGNHSYLSAKRDYCRRNGWQDAQCLATFAAPITRLSDASDPQTLARHRNEWSAKERQAVRDIRIRTWLTPIVFILFTLFSLAWPWFLVALISSLRKYLVYISIAAIPGQIFIFYIINLLRQPFLAAVEWPRLGLICVSLIPVFVVLQFGYFIWRKWKPKSQKRIPASSS